MTLESSKNLGGVGALLIVIGCLGFLGAYTGILSLIGLILVLMSLNGLANQYNERGIFNYALYGILTVIVGAVVTVAIVFVGLLDFLHEIGISLTDVAALTRVDLQRLVTLEAVWPFLTGLVLALVVLFVVLVISSFLIKKSLDLTSAKTGVGMFHTAGLLLLIGAFLTIIIIGFLLIFVAMILLIVAFFQIRTQPTAAPSPPPTSPQ